MTNASLLEIVPKHYHARIQSLIKNNKLNSKQIIDGLQSKNPETIKSTRKRLAEALQVNPSSLRLKRKKTKNIAVVPEIPFLDLMKEYFSNPKDQKQLDVLQKLVLLNKTYHNIFHEHLDRIQDQIKMIVTLCHFFDLTRKYPKNTFQARVGVHFYLRSPKNIRDRTDYQIYLENDHFYLYQQPYSDKKPSTTSFPNTKKGFIDLLDVFVPIFRKSEFALAQRWDMLRPLTPFDKQILTRYHLNRMSPKKNKNATNNTVFVIDPETISYWDMSYLKNSPW